MTDHDPSAAAVVVRVCDPTRTTTVAPGCARPVIGGEGLVVTVPFVGERIVSGPAAHDPVGALIASTKAGPMRPGLPGIASGFTSVMLNTHAPSPPYDCDVGSSTAVTSSSTVTPVAGNDAPGAR